MARAHLTRARRRQRRAFTGGGASTRRRARDADPKLAAVLQAFCKCFQRSVVPMPRISKECLGGFVGFQRVTIDPNELSGSPNFLRPCRPQSSAPRREKA